MFESTRKKKKDKKHLIGSAVVADHAAVEMTEKANVEYHKPKYSSQNRKKFYDNHSALNNAKDKAFKNGENAIDPYSGKNLVKTQKEAVANYGDDWQAHVAESDHIYPLNKGVKDFQDDAFLKTDDIKEIMNSEDNIQIISRKNNQTGGKGGQTQKEWSTDQEEMERLGKDSGRSSSEVSEQIVEEGERAKEIIDKRKKARVRENVIKTANSSGLYAAGLSAAYTGTTSTISNISAVVSGEKDLDDALLEITEDTVKATTKGYAYGAGTTTLNHFMSSSTSKFIAFWGKNNVPGKIISAVSVTGKTVCKWADGTISDEECIREVGKNGSTFVGSKIGSVVGNWLIPIPVFGEIVGCMLGGTLFNYVYNWVTSLTDKYAEVKREERERIEELKLKAALELQRQKEFQEIFKSTSINAIENSLIFILKSETFKELIIEIKSYFVHHAEIELEIAMSIDVMLRLRYYRERLDEYASRYCEDLREFFDESFEAMDIFLKNKEYDNAIAASNSVTIAFGEKPAIESTEDLIQKITKKEKIKI